MTCPLTTGIFVRIAKDDGSLNPKFPGGGDRQAERLREEGHRILWAKGKFPPRVAQVS